MSTGQIATEMTVVRQQTIADVGDEECSETLQPIPKGHPHLLVTFMSTGFFAVALYSQEVEPVFNWALENGLINHSHLGKVCMEVLHTKQKVPPNIRQIAKKVVLQRLEPASPLAN